MSNTAEHIVDRAAENAEAAIRSTQRHLNGSLDRLSGKVESAHDQAVPVINRVTTEAEELARRSLSAVRERSDQVRERALRMQARTEDSIRAEPIKSVLIAAAVGAAVVFLGSLMSRTPRGS